MNDQIEILDYTGPGYMPIVDFGAWRVAFLRCEERLAHLKKLERHMETDEVFVLLEGKATLYIGLEKEPFEMEPFKMYNVKQAVWHAIVVSEDAKVLIVENRDTTEANSEYIEL